MKKIYKIAFNLKPDMYFSNLKKCHRYCLDNNLSVMRTFAMFKRWIDQDGRYEIKDIAIIWPIDVN